MESVDSTQSQALDPLLIAMSCMKVSKAKEHSLKTLAATYAAISMMTEVPLKCFGEIFQLSWFKLSLLFCVKPPTHRSRRASLLRSS